MLGRLPWILAGLFAGATIVVGQEPIAPKEAVKLCDGKSLAGWTTWLKDAKRDDPRKVFTVKDGVIHVSGDGFGYLATDKEYRDYHLTLEYKWGKKTDGGKSVRNSGVLLNAIGPHGGAAGSWMSSIECQIAQGCVGDLIPIRGKNERGVTVPVEFSAQSEIGPDKRPRWKVGGATTTFTNRQLWWNKHEPGFKELLDTRGKDDLESPLGEWTKVECLCRDKTIEIRVNGKTVNKAFNVFPAAGKILLQSEGFEVYFRNVELRPAQREKDPDSVRLETHGKEAELEGRLVHVDEVRWVNRDRYRYEAWTVSEGSLAIDIEFGGKKELLALGVKFAGNRVVIRGVLEEQQRIKSMPNLAAAHIES